MAQWQASLLCPVSVPHGQDTALSEPGQARLTKEAWPAKEGSHGEDPILLGSNEGPSGHWHHHLFQAGPGARIKHKTGPAPFRPALLPTPRSHPNSAAGPPLLKEFL